MMEAKLKPCPFCGGKAYVAETYISTFENRAIIKCRCCGAQLDWTQDFQGEIMRKSTGEVIKSIKVPVNMSPFDAWDRRAGENQNEWISVDDRLPGSSGDYLVLTPSNLCEVLHFSAVHKLFNSNDVYDEYEAKLYSIDVSYWMPLPEPPEMKGGE